MQKRWFHATTRIGLKGIKKDKMLFPPKGTGEVDGVFLARNLNELIRMINLPMFTDLRKCEVILSVKYTPNNIDDDYNPRSWEMIVRKPIPLKYVVIHKYL